MKPLENRVVIVTGAAQGIGAVYAKALADAGAKLVLCDLKRPVETAGSLKEQGTEVLDMACDVTDAKAVGEMVEQTIERFGAVHVLVNNAALFGTLSLKQIEDISSQEWDTVMSVNVRGSFECIKAVLPVMKKNGYGKIINIASGTVFKGAPMMLSYVASKGAIVAMTRAVARETGNAGIRCNCLAPGLTMSDNVKNNNDWAENIVADNIASRCLKREATPDDLVGTLIFLSSSASDFMSGQTVVVDGGSVTH